MPQLFITSTANNQWVARLANTELEWPFAGSELETQFWAVRDFANFLTRGDMISACRSLTGWGVTEADLVATSETIFSTADALWLEERVVYTVEEVGAVLMEEVIAAGEALAAALL